MLSTRFTRSLAIIIGINRYANGISPLKTAVNDAHALATLLKQDHEYDVCLFTDEAAKHSDLLELLEKFLPETVTSEDRIVFYFAGHGVALDGDDGPAGYLVPQDADPNKDDTFLSMQRLHDVLNDLPCRHSLIILDCCFSGAFRWSTTRDISTRSDVLYQERFDRFIDFPAWQVITSAAYDQTALDLLTNSSRGVGRSGQHSPFAEALIDGLKGLADLSPSTGGLTQGNGVITATELYLYLRDRVEPTSERQHHRQTPGLWHLSKHDKGEYIFLVPGHELNLPPAPPLNENNNPYLGLRSFEENHSHLFFGREAAIQQLYDYVKEHVFTAVLGASGAGKSSLVKAGLLPALRQPTGFKCEILPAIRPGESPLRALAEALLSLPDAQKCFRLLANSNYLSPKSDLFEALSKQEAIDELAQTLKGSVNQLAVIVNLWSRLYPKTNLVIIIDQFEELITVCRNGEEKHHFLQLLAGIISRKVKMIRIIITLRSDFEPLFILSPLKSVWMQSRFLVPALTQNELRQAIVGPARERVLYFEPSNLVDQLINEVAQMPGALPLLSFTLSELYRKYLHRRSDNRALTYQDYEDLSGVVGALTQRANEEFKELVQQNPTYGETLRQVFLRMIAMGRGELTRRRVTLSELEYPEPLKNERVAEAVRRFVDARLLVQGQSAAGEAFVEPAHDALILGWDRLLEWKRGYEGELMLQRSLNGAAREWQERGGVLWNADSRLDDLKAIKNATSSWLNSLEVAFVQQSLNQRRKNRLARYGSLTAFIVGLGVASAITFWQLTESQRRGIENLAALAAARQQSNDFLGALVAGAESSQQVMTANQGSEGILQQRARPNLWNSTQLKVTMVLHQTLSELREQNRLVGHSDLITEIDTRRDCLGYRELIASASRDGTVRLWSPDTSSILHESETEINSIRFSPNCQLVAAADYFGTIRVWQVKDGLVVQEFQQTDPVSTLDWSPDGEHLVTGDQYGLVTVWSLKGEQVAAWSAHEGQVNRIRFSPACVNGGNVLASAGEFGKVHFWTLEGRLLETLSVKDEAWISDISFSPNCDAIALASHNSEVQLWQRKGKNFILSKTFAGHRGPVHSVDFSQDGQWIVSAGGEDIQNPNSVDNNIILWDRQGGISRTFEGHQGPVMSIQFLSDDRTLVSASNDQTIRTWNLEGASPIQDFVTADQQIVVDAKIAPEGDSFLWLNDRGEALLWNIESQTSQAIGSPGQRLDQIYHGKGGTPITVDNVNQTIAIWQATNTLKTVVQTDQPVNLIAANSSDSLLAWADTTNAVYLQDLEGDRTIPLLESQIEFITALAFSPNASVLAAADAEGTIRVWDRTGHLLREIRGGISISEETLQFSPDGQLLAALTQDGQAVQLWNLKGTRIAVLEGHDEPINSIRFSPSGRFLATASADRTARIWQLDDLNQSEPIVLRGHTDRVEDIVFRVDEKAIASIGFNDQIKVWGLNGEEISTLVALPDTRQIQFVNRGEKLLSVNGEGIVRVWNLDSNQLAEEAKNWLCNQYESSAFVDVISEASCPNSIKIGADLSLEKN